MTIIKARNAITLGLEQHIGCPVILSEQTEDMPGIPYCYYSVLVPGSTDRAFGLREVQETPDGYVLRRYEPVKASMSFTFCSENRETPDGYVFGEDEALELAEKARGYFLLNAHNIRTDAGSIVIRNISSAASRSGFLVEDTIRRYGFDILFAYVRMDEMQTSIIQNTGNPKGYARP